MHFVTNWKTTASAIGTFLIAAGTFLKTGTVSPEILTGITVAFGLLFAKDKNVTGGDTHQ